MKKIILPILIVFAGVPSFAQLPQTPSYTVVNEFRYCLNYAWRKSDYDPLKSRAYSRGRMYGYSRMGVDILIEEFTPLNDVWKIICEPLYWGGYGRKENIYLSLKGMGMKSSSANSMATFIYDYGIELGREENQRKQREAERLKKQEQLRLIKNRKRIALRVQKEVFPYDSIAPESYNEAVYQLDKRLKGICQKYATQYLDIDFQILVSVDSIGNTSVKKLRGLTDTSEVNKEIQEFITSFSLPPAEIKGMKCNSQFNYQFAHKSVYNEYDFDLLYNQKGISVEVRTREDDFIKKYLETNDLPYGKYNLKMKSLTVNDEEEKSLSVNTYKSFAGSGAFIPSLLIPGLGNRMVSGKGKSGIGITALCYSLVGTGVLAKLESNRQYKLYENETDPLKKFDYEENAKYWKSTSYWFIGTGSVIWLYNTYRVFKLGKRNQENKKIMEQRINPTIGYAPRNGFQFGLTYKF